MPFQPNVHDELTIDGIPYRIAEHPAAPGIPYGQEGRAGIVYQLLPAADRSAGFQPAMALKVFKPRFRMPYLVSQAEKLAAYADIPGLQAAHRRVLTRVQNPDLLQQHPDLIYAVLMPWIEGPTWLEVMLEKRPLPPQQALHLARGLAQVLEALELRGLAHCDLSAPNVMLPLLAGGTGVELVDLEGLYAPGMTRPQELSSGTAGYAHKQAASGLWGPEADRFAGAVLLAEMLGWCDPGVVQAAWGESYFDPQEMQQETPRYHTLVEALERRWGSQVALLFERAWRSDSLLDCPTFGEWLVMLPERLLVAEEERQEKKRRKNESRDAEREERETLGASVRAMMAAARRLEEQGKLDGALEVYRQALGMARSEPSLRSLVQEIELTIQDVQKRYEAEKQAKRKAEEEARRKAEEQAKRKAEEARRRAEEQARREWEERVRQAEEERRRQRRTRSWVLGGLALLLLALGGLWVLGQERRLSTPTPTQPAVAGPAFTPPPVQPAPTSAPGATAAPMSKPIPLPVLAGTPVPQPVAAISPENADRVVQLARWIQDRVSYEGSPGWSPQGTWLFVPSTTGVRLYSNDNFAHYRLIETGTHPVFSPDEKFIASTVNPPGTIRLTDVQSGDTIREWRPHNAAITDLWFIGNILLSRDENNVIIASDFTADPPAELLRTQTGGGKIFTLPDLNTLIEINTDLDQQPPTQQIQICRIAENKCEGGTNVDMGLDGLLLGISPNFNEGRGIVVIWKNYGEVVVLDSFGQGISTLGIYTDTTRLPHVRISPRGTYVVIGNEIRRAQDGQVIATGETLANQLGRDYPVHIDGVSFSPDERYLAIGRSPIDCLLLNLENGEIYSLKPPTIGSGKLPPPVFRPDSQEVMLAIIGPGGNIRVFSTADGRMKGEIDANAGSAVLRMAFTTAGDLAVLYPAELQVRSLHDGQILRTIRHNAGLDVALMEDGFYSLNDSFRNEVEYQFTPYTTQQPSRKMVVQRASEEETGYNLAINYVDFHVSRSFLFTFSPDHRYLIREAVHKDSDWSRKSSIVVLYDMDRPESLRTALPRPGGKHFSKLLLAPDSSLLAIGLEKEVILLSIPDMNIVEQHTTESEITGLAFAPDGKTIAIATDSAQFLLWNFERGTLERLDTRAEKNYQPAFSADGRLLAIAVPDGIQLWDVSDRQLLRTLEIPAVLSLAFSPDQKLLVAGTRQDIIYLWGVR